MWLTNRIVHQRENDAQIQPIGINENATKILWRPPAGKMKQFIEESLPNMQTKLIRGISSNSKAAIEESKVLQKMNSI